MLDFDALRTRMVDGQLRTNDVTNFELLAALLDVPREVFVPAQMKALAYLDEDIRIATGRYLMEPIPFGKLAQAAQVGPQDVVLDIGCGTGYSSAVFSRLASLVIGVEEDEALAAQATANLEKLGYSNVAIRKGALIEGSSQDAPFDVIFFNGSVEFIPETILNQLKDDGRLVAVEGHGNSAVAKLYRRDGNDVSPRFLFNSSIKPLPGFAKAQEFVL